MTRPDAERGIDVADPQVQFLVLTANERGLQFDVQCPRRLVAGDDRVVTRGDDAAQITQVEVLHLTLRRFGTIEPVGDAELGQQLLGHLDDAGLGHRRLPAGLELGVLLLDPRAHRGHSLAGQLGDRALLLGDLGEHGVPTGLARTEPLRLGTLRQLGRGLEVRPVAARRTLTPIVRGTTLATRAPVVTAAVVAAAVVALAVVAFAVIAFRSSRLRLSRRGRSRSPPLPSGRLRRARVSMTASNGSLLGRISSTLAPPVFSRPFTTDRISTPSSICSISTLSTSPTFAPSGRMDPSRTPFGFLLRRRARSTSRRRARSSARCQSVGT